MPQFSRTWWGQLFIEALERFTDPSRLSRGSSYASSGRVLNYRLEGGTVTATVRGSINPYYGVYKEPRYTTTIQLTPISAADWTKAIAALSANAGFVARLLMNEMPDDIEDAFTPLRLHLLPQRTAEFHTSCTCPDYANPCKHVAGLCYVLAAQLDDDPFLLFALRGLSKEALQKELASTPLGQILSAQLDAVEAPLTPAASYYTHVPAELAPAHVDPRGYWAGARRPAQPDAAPTHPGVAALVVKKQGDYPPFWHRGNSFIEAMEAVYERVRSKNRAVL